MAANNKKILLLLCHLCLAAKVRTGRPERNPLATHLALTRLQSSTTLCQQSSLLGMTSLIGLLASSCCLKGFELAVLAKAI